MVYIIILLPSYYNGKESSPYYLWTEEIQRLIIETEKQTLPSVQ